MKTLLTPKERAALGDATEALRTLTRLTEYRLAGSLTTNQDRDFTSAVRTYNEVRSVVDGLPELDTEAISIDELNRAVTTVVNLRKLDEIEDRRRRVADDVRTVAESQVESSGRHDPIREMLVSREYQTDFDFPDSEALRSIPFPGEGEEVRTTTDFGMGSSLYTSDFATRVAVYLRTESPWYGLSTIVTSDNGRPLVVPKLTGDPTVYTPGEGTAITASDATLANVTVTPTGYKALAYVSYEAYEDAEYNLTDIFARAQARAIGLAFGQDATTAVLAGINNGGTATGLGGGGTATFFGYEDLIDLELSRAAPYRGRGVYVMANGAIKKSRKFTDKNGQYLWQPAIGAATPAGISAHSVYEDPNLAAPASATKSVIFGDPSAGLIVKASPIRVAVSTEFKFDLDVIALKTVHRIALAVQDPAAMAYLVSANS